MDTQSRLLDGPLLSVEAVFGAGTVLCVGVIKLVDVPGTAYLSNQVRVTEVTSTVDCWMWRCVPVSLEYGTRVGVLETGPVMISRRRGNYHSPMGILFGHESPVYSATYDSSSKKAFKRPCLPLEPIRRRLHVGKGENGCFKTPR